jgi:PadR family transcriptional regulator, regulatory protein PadR
MGRDRWPTPTAHPPKFGEAPPTFPLDISRRDTTLYRVVVTVARRPMDRWETQLRKGVVELAVLATLARGEAYGYRIVEGLRALDGLELTESTVYPALTRLAREGYLAVRTEASPAGPPRRYYRLTDDGRSRLRRLAEGWRTVTRSLAGLIDEGAQA